MASQGKTVLVADDDRLVRETFRYTMEEEGYTVHTANDGAEAIRILSEERIDVALIDVFMPEKDGLETILDIRKHHPSTLVFAMSGYAGKGSQKYLSIAEKFGADRIIHKPTPPSQVIQLIKAYGERKGLNS